LKIDTKKIRERLDQVFEDLESARVSHLEDRSRRRALAGLIIPVGIAVGIWIGWVLLDADASSGFIMILIFATIYWAQGPSRKYRKRFKSLVIPHIAKELGDFIFKADGGIDMHDLKPSKIIPNHMSYETEDYICGTYQGVSIEFCEARMWNKRLFSRSKLPEIVFSGLIIFLSLNKPFAGHTIVRKEMGSGKPFIPFSGLELVQLEDPEFERTFKVHSTDQIEARRLLTPATIERLKSLAQVVGARSLECAFFNQKLLVLLPHSGAMTHYGPANPLGGFLEPGPLDFPVTQFDSVSKIVREFQSICSLVTELKLHEDHGV